MNCTVAHRIVERATRFTPLGIRFWDVAEAHPVTTGLRVTARAEGTTDRLVTAFRTASGVYAFQGLPGLRAVEFGDAPTDGPDVLPIQRRFVVEIEDLERRFSRTAFVIDLPREERGVYPPAPAGSLPDDAVPGFMLFSAPTRTPASGTAAVRAQLEDADTEAPAAYAVLAVEVDGETAYGIADEHGQVAVFFPYPAFHHTLTGSFPEGGLPLYAHTWEAVVRVQYAPSFQVRPPEATVPLLRSLFDQPEGLLYEEAPTSLMPALPSDALTVSLTFGQDLVLRTEGRSTLLIEPAPSIP